ncbi:hypothetical protein IMZ48_42340 [Candidatus Bathyarchaeota archaeon]|nr:hypothetical protein [Candidatus Bathyarchaeota archaeon]
MPFLVHDLVSYVESHDIRDFGTAWTGDEPPPAVPHAHISTALTETRQGLQEVMKRWSVYIKNYPSPHAQNTVANK